MRAPPIPLAVTMAALGASPSCFMHAMKLNVAGVQFDASQPGLRPRELDIGARRDVAATLRRHELVASGIDCFIPLERFIRLDAVERAMTALFESIAFAEFLGRVPVSFFMPQDADLANTISKKPRAGEFFWPISRGPRQTPSVELALIPRQSCWNRKIRRKNFPPRVIAWWRRA